MDSNIILSTSPQNSSQGTNSTYFNSNSNKITKNPIDTPDFEGYTPLHLCSEKGHHDIVHYLLSYHLDSDGNGNSPKSQLPTPPCIFNQTLLNSKSSSNTSSSLYPIVDGSSQTLTGLTPLHLASSNGHLQVVKCLCAFGADLESKDQQGNSPLQRAVLNNRKSVAIYLISQGANIWSKNHSGISAYDLATDELQALFLSTPRLVPSLKNLCYRSIRKSQISENILNSLPYPLPIHISNPNECHN